MRKSLVVAAALAALVIPAVAFAAAGDFGQQSTSPETVGASPTSVVAANVNGDSNLDLAVANGGPDNVSILLGDGNGDFTAAGTSPESVGTDPSALTFANLNGDSNIDLAVANSGTDNVTILLGDGAGDFTAPVTSPETVGDQPGSLTAADLDGDTDTDLAVASFVPAEVAILLNNGSGDFTPAATSPEDVGGVATNTSSVVSGDFNGAGGNDLAVGSEFSNNVKVLLNSGLGNGNFTAAGTSPEAAGDPHGMTTANLNADANLDLVTANSGQDNVTILLGDGTGNFTATATSPGVGDFPVSVVAADLSGDNLRDLAVTNAASDNVSILVGNGAGGFTAAPTSPEGAGDFPASVVAAPLNGDNDRDLAVANQTSGNVTILLNDATSTPPPSGNPPATPPAATPSGPKKKCKKGKKKAAVAKKCGKRK